MPMRLWYSFTKHMVDTSWPWSSKAHWAKMDTPTKQSTMSLEGNDNTNDTVTTITQTAAVTADGTTGGTSHTYNLAIKAEIVVAINQLWDRWRQWALHWSQLNPPDSLWHVTHSRCYPSSSSPSQCSRFFWWAPSTLGVGDIVKGANMDVDMEERVKPRLLITCTPQGPQ